MDNYFRFIYEWTDSINNRTYTGSHKGKPWTTARREAQNLSKIRRK